MKKTAYVTKYLLAAESVDNLTLDEARQLCGLSSPLFKEKEIDGPQYSGVTLGGCRVFLDMPDKDLERYSVSRQLS